jgi:hypothetical protein
MNFDGKLVWRAARGLIFSLMLNDLLPAFRESSNSKTG